MSHETRAVTVTQIRSISAVTTGWPVKDGRQMALLVCPHISVAPCGITMRQTQPVAAVAEEGAMLMMIGMSFLMSVPSYLGAMQPRH